MDSTHTPNTYKSPPKEVAAELRPNEKIRAFRVTGLKILGRVGTPIFLIIFLEIIYDFMHFERHFAFRNA